jgi:hypothetical protein
MTKRWELVESSWELMGGTIVENGVSEAPCCWTRPPQQKTRMPG